MPFSLSNAMRGAGEAGERVASENLKAQILAKYHEVLNGYKEKAAATQQENVAARQQAGFEQQTSERLAGQDFNAEQNALDRDFDYKQSGLKSWQGELDRKADQENELTLIEQREKMKNKYGNNKTTTAPVAPTKMDLARINNMLDKDPELKGIENKEQFSFAVGSRARELMSQQRIGSFDATRQALAELKAQVTPGEKTTTFGFNLNPYNDTAPRFDPNMGAGANTETWPGHIPSPEARIIGRTYETPKGQMKWMGNGWLPTQ